MLKSSLATVAMGLLVSCFAAQPLAAAPILYAIHFTPGPGTLNLPTSASFIYDSDIPEFTNFHIVWVGVDLDFTAAANAPLVDPADPVCSGSGAASTFAMLSGACSANGVFWHGDGQRFLMEDIFDHLPHIEVNFSAPGNPIGRGGWTISEVPEPASMLMLFLGLACLLGAGRRIR